MNFFPGRGTHYIECFHCNGICNSLRSLLDLFLFFRHTLDAQHLHVGRVVIVVSRGFADLPLQLILRVAILAILIFLTKILIFRSDRIIIAILIIRIRIRGSESCFNSVILIVNSAHRFRNNTLITIIS